MDHVGEIRCFAPKMNSRHYTVSRNLFKKSISKWNLTVIAVLIVIGLAAVILTVALIGFEEETFQDGSMSGNDRTVQPDTGKTITIIYLYFYL